MKKIEIIWRELLFQSIEKRNRESVQKDLAEKFSFSTSTVFQALKPLREMGAVRVTGRNFVLEDPEKLLYYWASFRNIGSDIVSKVNVELPIKEIEGLVLPDTVFTAYRAALEYLPQAPADYDKIYLYTQNPEEVLARYKLGKGRDNLFLLKADPFLTSYGEVTTIAQTYVDLWNLQDWYAKEFTKALKEKIDELLS